MPGISSGVERWWAVSTGLPHGLQTPYSRAGVQRDADPLAPGGQFHALLPGLEIDDHTVLIAHREQPRPLHHGRIGPDRYITNGVSF